MISTAFRRGLSSAVHATSQGRAHPFIRGWRSPQARPRRRSRVRIGRRVYSCSTWHTPLPWTRSTGLDRGRPSARTRTAALSTLMRGLHDSVSCPRSSGTPRAANGVLLSQYPARRSLSSQNALTAMISSTRMGYRDGGERATTTRVSGPGSA